MLRYKKEHVGKIHALRAMQYDGCLSSDVENKAAPYLKGQTLLQYLIGTNGIDGMLKRQLPKNTIQRVLARCMKEKEKKKDLDAAQGIWGFVEFLKSNVATNKEGIPDLIIEMGYERHFPSKWAHPTPKNLFYQMKPLMPYLPTLTGFDEPIQEKILLEHTTLSAPKIETPFDNYYNRLSNLVHSTEMGRYQEGLAFGCDILQCYPDGGEKALQVYLFLAECGGALYSHALAKTCFEKASQLADSDNQYQCATIASSVQTVFRMWGCFEEESAVYHQESLGDPFSSIHAKSLSQHVEAQFDLLINTLAERSIELIFHKSCPEECHTLDGQRKTQNMIQDLKKMATNDYYLALLYTCEAADLVIQLRTVQNMNIERLTGAALFTAQLARKTKRNDPMIKSLIAVLKLHSELSTKKYFLIKMSKISQSMSKTTRTRNSLLAANIFFSQAVLMSILGPTGRHVKTFFRFALRTFRMATNHQHYRIHLIEQILTIVFGNVQHIGETQLLPTSPTHIIQALAAQDILCGEPHLGNRQSVESIVRENPHLMGSLAFGLESIKNRI